MNPFGLLALTASVLPLISAQNKSATFTNPVLNEVGADPFVVKDGGYYYMTYTTTTNITILRSTSLTDWDNADVKLAFDPPVCFKTDKKTLTFHLLIRLISQGRVIQPIYGICLIA